MFNHIKTVNNSRRLMMFSKTLPREKSLNHKSIFDCRRYRKLKFQYLSCNSFVYKLFCICMIIMYWRNMKLRPIVNIYYLSMIATNKPCCFCSLFDYLHILLLFGIQNKHFYFLQHSLKKCRQQTTTSI